MLLISGRRWRVDRLCGSPPDAPDVGPVASRVALRLGGRLYLPEGDTAHVVLREMSTAVALCCAARRGWRRVDDEVPVGDAPN